ncbi:hypothetical protein [Streptomyces canus]|nr:hypothetical protein [Streptomyces canus]WSD87302.1 hypothetical protein OG925_24660 [Streptomyces canus]
MDAMSGNVAGVRGSARHFIEDLAPAIAVEAADTVGSWSFGTRHQRPA